MTLVRVALPTTALAPVFLTELVGRAAHVEQVTAVLRGARLVSLVGPGGTGKTRLAAAVAEAVAADPAVEIAWIDVVALTDGGLAAHHVAATLGLREGAGRTPERALVERICGRPMLLVFDNCEHVLGACARLADGLLRGCPQLRILTTSREPLGVPGERAWRVPPLDVPAASDAAARDAPAVQLFAQRATDALPGFTLTDANLPAIVRICRRVDGLPLAIELAAARVTVLTPDQLADRLDDMFRILASRSASLPPRHRTLRGLMDWSYDLLSSDEQGLFTSLAVFAGDFSIDAAETIIAGDATVDVLDLLAALVEKSLVVMREAGGEARYSMLEPIRRYATERLTANGNAETIDRLHYRHACYFAEFAARRAAAPYSGDADARDRLGAEHDNVLAALDWALSREHAELALRLCLAMRDFWPQRGYLQAGLGWMLRAIEAAQPHTMLDRLRARALVAASIYSRRLGEYMALQAWLAEAESIARALDDAALLADALTQLGHSLRDRGEIDAARQRVDEAIALWRGADDERGLSAALGTRASLALAVGDTQLACSLRTEAAAIARRAGDREAEAFALIGLGEVARMQAELAEARAHNRRALQQFTELGDSWHAAAAYHNLGWIEIQDGRDREAVDAFAQCIALFRSAGNPFGLTLCLYGFARLLLIAGDAQAATVALAAATTQAARVGVRPAAPADIVAVEETTALVEAALSDAARAEAAALGANMSIEAGLDRALARLRELLPASIDEPAAVHRTAVNDRAPAPDTGEPDESDVAYDLRVLALGPLTIEVDGCAVDTDAFAGKPRELLLLLLCHPDGRTREQVGLAFWPDASTTQVKNNFHVTLHRLRRALGRADWIVLDGERYRLDPALRLEFDVARFETGARAALEHIHDDVDARRRLDRALDRYRGDFLEDSTVGDWHLELRDRLRRLHTDALLAKAAVLLDDGRFDDAASAYRTLLARDPLHEAACRGLMTCLAGSGQRVQAIRVYERFAILLRDELGVEPDALTADLFHRLQRAEAV